ncbi:MAG: 50S ribosomal protein L18 [Gemmatimonadetes bacterium]|nr:MAG: 50S ribosomal protein L18 [Gemmatimonadota bacterium]
MSKKRRLARAVRRRRVRKKVIGTAERPRLNVFRSSKHIYAQLINDKNGTTLASASTLSEDVRSQVTAEMKKCERSKLVGKAIAERARSKGITAVTFDRNGYVYHGRIQALAEGAREAGLEF